MNVAIVGGTGFLGKQLAGYLLRRTGWAIGSIAHSDKRFGIAPEYQDRVDFRIGDVLDSASITAALHDAEVAYYFVHMMGRKDGNFYDLELQGAKTFGQAALDAGVRRIVYMGGLGNNDAKLSEHLASRHRTGEILRSFDIEVIEFQASMIIGRGSVGFDIIANLVDRLPVMVLPRTAATMTQPIVLEDALEYLRLAATVQSSRHEVVQIGGPDRLSYADLYRLYADYVDKHRLVLRAPFIPAWLEARFLNAFTPSVHARIGKAMAESLANEMIVTSGRAVELFPSVRPRPVGSTLAFLAPNGQD